MGACFPPDFGGSCIGTPPDCLNCNLVLDCQEGQQEEEEGQREVFFNVVESEENGNFLFFVYLITPGDFSIASIAKYSKWSSNEAQCCM